MKPASRLIGLLAWVCVALLCPSAVVAGDKDALDPAKPPAFGSTSKEPVLLRYKMKPGQVEKLAMDMDIDVTAHQGGQDLGMKMVMRIEAKTAVKEVDDDGNISALVKITRMTLKMSGQQEAAFDSDKPDDDNPQFKAASAMINVGIPVKISPVGKLLETDLEPLRLAAKRLGDAALSKSLEDGANKMFEGVFIDLPEKPVRVGDAYKAGTIVEEKFMKMHLSYKIRSVSGDGAQVVLEPVATMEVAPEAFPGTEVKVKEQQFDGWKLFDAARGHMSKAAGRMKFVLDINAGGQTATLEMTGTFRVTSSLE
jgi:hypothetical protein